MRGIPRWAIVVLSALAMAVATFSCAAQAPDSFRWVDFHSPKDQDVVNWVTHALAGQKWTAIREIGVQYDGALVITTYRNSPQGTPNRDSFSIWSVSLANRAVTHLIDGTNLRPMDWLLLNVGQGRELSALYDVCRILRLVLSLRLILSLVGSGIRRRIASASGRTEPNCNRERCKE